MRGARTSNLEGDAHWRPLLRTVEGPPPGGIAYAAARVRETDVVVNTLGHGIHAAFLGVRGVLRANRVASHIAAEAAKTSAGSARAVGRSLLAVGDRSPRVGDAPYGGSDTSAEMGAKSGPGVAVDIRAAARHRAVALSGLQPQGYSPPPSFPLRKPGGLS